MTWESIYLACFVVGCCLSVIAFAAGAAHLHLPKGFHVHTHGHGAGHAGSHGGVKTSWFNLGTLTVFLAWFGGTGYLLTRYSNLLAILGLLIAVLSGLGGASVVFWFLYQIQSRERDLDPVDYNMIGVLGKVSGPVRAGGTGEMIYVQGGVRRCTPIRAEEPAAIERGAEVVVMRYEKGIAYVRRWEEVSNLS